MIHKHRRSTGTWLLVLALGLTSCMPGAPAISAPPLLAPATSVPTPMIVPTSLPTRPNYAPGELVDYTAQDGDTVAALAGRFNTTVAEIMAANPIIPADATTMPPGMPMKIPIYYRALWGSQFHTLPDHAFVNGPTVIGFNTNAFVLAHEGWLKDYRAYVGDAWRDGPQIVDYVATNFSISPRLLLALLEYQGGALSQPQAPVSRYVLGHRQVYYESMYLQLVWAANTLNNAYYSWRAGTLLEFDLPDGALVRPDPWQNAASVALQYYFSRIFAGDQFAIAIGPTGLLQTYTSLFGDPWAVRFTLIPGSLRQPDLTLPFTAGHVWSYTGGPHTGWGTGEPFAALDFAPPSQFSGCFKVDEDQFATAVADGQVVRSDVDGVVLDLDLDKDSNERTGWVIYYLHLAAAGRAPAGKALHAGDPIGYPSCEGGRVTGTHVHIARKYNGEWILAGGILPFTMDGWIAHDGVAAYKGTLTRGSQVVRACDCSDAPSTIIAGPR
ncbi:MAG: LysM peptidoglycan-binding domain-containing protein [Bacteroidota bacterium]